MQVVPGRLTDQPAAVLHLIVLRELGWRELEVVEEQDLFQREVETAAEAALKVEDLEEVILHQQPKIRDLDREELEDQIHLNLRATLVTVVRVLWLLEFPQPMTQEP